MVCVAGETPSSVERYKIEMRGIEIEGMLLRPKLLQGKTSDYIGFSYQLFDWHGLKSTFHGIFVVYYSFASGQTSSNIVRALAS